MSEPEPTYRPGALVRLLSIPLVPLVALWEALKALPRAIGWVLERIGALLRTIGRGIWGLLTAIIRLLVAPVLRSVGRALRWIAVQAATAILPVLIRAGLLLRGVLQAVARAIRALWVRLLIPLRLVGRLALALLRRAAVYLRLMARALWLALKAVWVRILLPLRLLGRAIRWIGRGIWNWLLAPVGRAIRATFQGAWWLLRWIGRGIWNWLLAPVGRAIRATFRGAWWLLRELGAGLRAGALRLLLLVLPVLVPAWQAARKVAAALVAAAQLAWRLVITLLRAARALLAWLVRPFVFLWRTAASAVSAAAATVGAAARAARGAVRLAVHDATNQVRRAIGRPPLPALVDRPWQPPHQVHRGRQQTTRPALRTAFMGAAFLVVALALSTIILAALNAPRPSSLANATRESQATPIPPPTNVTDKCGLLQPGGPLSLAESGCGTLAFGWPLVTLDCSKTRSLPAAFSVAHYDDIKSQVTGGPPLHFTGTSCALTAPAQQLEEVDTAADAPNNLIIVADFVAPPAGEFTIGLNARCNSNECVNAWAGGSGRTYLEEWLTTYWLTHVRQDWTLRPGQLNRLVMWLNGANEEAWLNGQFMGSSEVKTGRGTGDVRFFINNEGAGDPIEVDLQQLVILGVA